jgi:hypothetical protein
MHTGPMEGGTVASAVGRHDNTVEAATRRVVVQAPQHRARDCIAGLEVVADVGT